MQSGQIIVVTFLNGIIASLLMHSIHPQTGDNEQNNSEGL